MLICNVGFPIAIAIYLLLRDVRRDKVTTEREHRLGERIDQLEDSHRGELKELIQASVGAIGENSINMKRLIRTQEDISKLLQGRPCLAEEAYCPTPALVARQRAQRIHDPSAPTGETDTVPGRIAAG